MTYYLKYRPQTIYDLDIISVREAISNIAKSGNISHSFLFSGPKGTGKTSAARILAKIINCEQLRKDGEPCNKCYSCKSVANGTNIDVIEMDAASNRGIDDIRVLRDIVKLSPAKSRAKVYIIDEAHMLTTEASNALLKTLEEPPSHVYFILATTNPEKIISTIKSRTVLVNFTKATAEETKRSLKRIVKLEKIKIENEDIDKIIKIAKGSFRDAVKLLEQFSKDKKILDNQDVFNADIFVEIILSKEIEKVITDLNKAIEAGVDINDITTEILQTLQRKLVEEKSDEIIQLIELLLDAQSYNKVTPIEELPLEIALIKWCKI